MRELRDYLYSQAVADFKPSELSEPLLSVYNFIESALRDDCDALRFDARGVTWLRGNVPVKRFDQHVRQTISFRESMGRIVERDAIVRQHLEVVAEGPEAITYRIIGVAVPTAQTSMAGATIPATARGGGAT